jgi:hypothetical protein
VRHGRYVVFQLAEVAVPPGLFVETLCRIERLRSKAPPNGPTRPERSLFSMLRARLDAESLAFEVKGGQAQPGATWI